MEFTELNHRRTDGALCTFHKKEHDRHYASSAKILTQHAELARKMQSCSACKASKQVVVYPGGGSVIPRELVCESPSTRPETSLRESLSARACPRELFHEGLSTRACPRRPVVPREPVRESSSTRACPREPVGQNARVERASVGLGPHPVYERPKCSLRAVYEQWMPRPVREPVRESPSASPSARPSARACPREPVRRELLGYSAEACPREPIRNQPARAGPRAHLQETAKAGPPKPVREAGN